MKLPILAADKKRSGEKTLPVQFDEKYRPDLIARAVHALQSAARQAYGSSTEAGFRHSSSVSKRRRDWRGSYGFGISRVNRKIHSHRGTRFGWVGAFSPQTRGGFRAHPPKVYKDWEQKINQKENAKAIRSAIAATVNKNLVEKRGHHVPAEYPFIIASSFEQVSKTNEVEKAFVDLGFTAELERSAQKKVRAGIGKMRGRRYRRRKGILLVVSGDCPVIKAAQNIPGTDVVEVHALNAEVLAPGAHPGRVTLWTENAVEILAKQNLFNY